MKKDKATVGIVFGGKSGEHDVSIESAKAICRNIDRDKYIPLLIYINRRGKWTGIEERDLMEAPPYQGTGLDANLPGPFLSLSPWEGGHPQQENIDIFFPILHGPNGEDGKIQGLWEMAGIPYVGANSFASALAMDKMVSKTLFAAAGIKTPEFLVFTDNQPETIRAKVSRELAYPVFVKPCSLGSSVGISKVKKESQLKAALDLAFSHDKKIIVERGIDAREIEVSVMGNQEILVSQPGELTPGNEFYDYEDKYLGGNTRFQIPVKLDAKIEKQIRDLAARAFRALYLNGMSRVDFLLEKETEDIYLNEINTIPGFTEISMFPKLWQVQGVSFQELVTRLIEYGFEYFDGKH